MRRPTPPLGALTVVLAALTGIATPAHASTPAHRSTTSHTSTTSHAPAIRHATNCTAPIRPASVLAVEPCDSPDRVIDKAAHIVPRPANLTWQRKEVTA